MIDRLPGEAFDRIYMLVDCNNFFASCELIFRPDLEGRPILVLSNNDGCVVARSQESKALGIPMGEPVFKIKDIIRRYKIVCFSSNFTLYQDISRRVMTILSNLSYHCEVYSVDEAFLMFQNITETEAIQTAVKIRNAIFSQVGINVGIGIATTKTLAKLANHHAKSNVSDTFGIYSVLQPIPYYALLKANPIEEVWGVGRRLSARLRDDGVRTAFQLSRLDQDEVRKAYSIVLVRTIQELNNIAVIPTENLMPVTEFTDEEFEQHWDHEKWLKEHRATIESLNFDFDAEEDKARAAGHTHTVITKDQLAQEDQCHTHDLSNFVQSNRHSRELSPKELLMLIHETKRKAAQAESNESSEYTEHTAHTEPEEPAKTYGQNVADQTSADKTNSDKLSAGFSDAADVATTAHQNDSNTKDETFVLEPQYESTRAYEQHLAQVQSTASDNLVSETKQEQDSASESNSKIDSQLSINHDDFAHAAAAVKPQSLLEQLSKFENDELAVAKKSNEYSHTDIDKSATANEGQALSKDIANEEYADLSRPLVSLKNEADFRRLRFRSHKKAKVDTPIECSFFTGHNKATITWSRSFSKRLFNIEDLHSCIANFVALAAQKLRAQQKFCRKIGIHIRTSYFGDDEKYVGDLAIRFDVPTADTRDLVKAAVLLLHHVYRPGFAYAKAGIILTELSDNRTTQGELITFLENPNSKKYDEHERERSDRLMAAMDYINSKGEHKKIYLASQGHDNKKFADKKALSPCYTTKWQDLPIIE